MLGWPTGVGEDRFFSCILLSNVEASPNLALMSLLISRDTSVRSVMCEVTPAELANMALHPLPGGDPPLDLVWQWKPPWVFFSFLKSPQGEIMCQELICFIF